MRIDKHDNIVDDTWGKKPGRKAELVQRWLTKSHSKNVTKMNDDEVELVQRQMTETRMFSKSCQCSKITQMMPDMPATELSMGGKKCMHAYCCLLHLPTQEHQPCMICFLRKEKVVYFLYSPRMWDLDSRWIKIKTDCTMYCLNTSLVDAAQLKLRCSKLVNHFLP